jgi:hypothetical protein
MKKIYPTERTKIWVENGAVALAQRLGSPCEKGEQQERGDGEMINGGVSLQAGDALMDLTLIAFITFVGRRSSRDRR